jgi:hypothetical protein
MELDLVVRENLLLENLHSFATLLKMFETL